MLSDSILAPFPLCPRYWPKHRLRGSGVCLLVSLKEHEAFVILTRRSLKVSSHKGQISFAGGRQDDKDVGPVDTALRELEEELGVHEDKVKVTGCLEPIEALDGHLIYPVVAVTQLGVDELVPCSHEVAEVLAVPLAELQQQKSLEFEFCFFGRRRHSYLFETSVCRIWGLTARMLYEANLGTQPR